MATRTIIKQKKGVLIRDVVIAGILFAGMIGLFVLAIGGIQQEYDSSILTNDQFSSHYNKIYTLTNGVAIAQNATSDTQGLSFKGTFDVAYQSTFTVIAMVWDTVSIFGSMTGNFAEDFGLDATVTNLVITIALSILTITIVFIWISSVSRGRL